MVKTATIPLMENAPAPGPPPINPNQNGGSQYSFITDPYKPVKRSLFSFGSTKKSRILLVVGGLVGLAMIGGLIALVIGGLDSAAKQDWLTLAQKQQELIRISDEGSKKAQNRDTKNLATTTKIALESSQAGVNSLAKKNGAAINSKTLALGKDAKTDAALKTAEQTNQFDSAFQKILQTELNEYQAILKKLYENTNSNSTKTGLTNAYNNAQILAAEANR